MISLNSEVICVWRARLYELRQRADHVVGIFRRGLHRHPAEDLLADGRIQKTFEQPGLERGRHDLFKNFSRRRQKLVFDRPSVARGRLGSRLGIRLQACRSATAFRATATCREADSNLV